ncbi:filamentous hemagglutinin N-terminal domain-containing protein [Polynucleobacter paneuropaeus]|nr:filamentous hemagglutinin N-terminal domain-containing protein [Polynucleobacter paneuropaeus]
MSNTSRNLGISFLLSKKHAHRNDGHGVSVRKTVMASVFLSATLLTVPSAFAAPATNALPTNGQVVAGQANISQTGNVMNINQSTQRAVINWDSFNVGKNATVNFNQPNSGASTLNRVNGASQSMINGAVNANGQVIFVNPNGVVFGKGAEVNTGGLVATTMNIKDSDYMSGKMSFSGGESGKVINKGTITANGVNGYIALMAPEVKNQGVLIANISNSNTIALVSGTKVTLSFDGSQLTNITVDASAINSLISNKHAITTNGGQIIIAANAASNLKASVINNTGTISADTVSTVGGKVFLTAGTVNQSGTVSANSAEADGGNVTISGNQVNLNSASKTTATGATAGGQILIGKTTQNAAQSQVNASNVTVSQGALLDASATQNGNGGSIQVWSTISTSIAGLFRANGGALGGNGGTIDTSSAGAVTYGKGLVVDTTAPKGKTGNWLTDPLSIIIDSTAATILSNALLTTNVTLDATASSCAGIGNCTTSSVPLIQFLAGTSVYSTANTALTLNATGGTITMDGSIAVGQVYAVAQTINVNGSLNTTASSNGSIYLAGAIINILGNINSNGNSSNNSSSSNLTSANITTANNRRNGVNGSNNQTNSTSALNADDTTYTSNGGAINIIASGDINIGSSSIISTTNNSSYISANGQSGGTINIISVNGNINNQGIVDALGKTSTGGTVIIAAKNTNTFTGGLISVDGYSQAGVIQIGVANGIGSGSTLAPPSINSQVATLLAAVNFTPSSNSSILTSDTSLDNATVITANSAASTSQVTLNSQAGQIYIAGNNSLNTAATIQANADTGGLIILSSPAGNYQNTGYIQTNGGAGLGGTIAQSGLISTTLIGATVEANGTLGGGNIIIGRDFQASPLSGSATQAALLPSLSSVITLPTSASTTIDANSSLSANSTLSGDGGNVLVWGDGNLVAGALSAGALGASGNGGFIETSGDTLSIATGASVSAARANGTSGTWLLDSYDVTIAATGATGTTYSATFTAGATSTILASAINASLNGGTSVSISTGSSSSNTIYVNSAISATSGTATLTLTGGTINLAANITTVGSQTYTGAVTLGANTALTATNSNITFSSTVDSTAGSYYGLSITNGTGTTAFGGVVGANSATSALGYLCINASTCNASTVGTYSGTGSGTTTLAGNVTTSGNQTYAGALTLGADTALTSTANSGNGVVTIAGSISATSVSGLSIQFLYSNQYIYNGTTYSIGAGPLSSSISGSNGSYTYTLASSSALSYLIVGGGGGGGYYGGGGGGGGGVLAGSSTFSAGSYTITVGSGGSGSNIRSISGSNGNNSSISGPSSSLTFNQIALGGGGGGSNARTPGSSGTGGGAGLSYASYAAGTVGQGNSGGYKTVSSGNGITSTYAYGGSDGIGGGGGGGTSNWSTSAAGNGGDGAASSITGTLTYYAGGGGGSINGTNIASGGLGGGGSGGGSGTYPSAGSANQGGGGGGAYTNTSGASGGSGIVILGTPLTQNSFSLTINSGTGATTISGSVSNVTTLTINSKSPLSAVSGAIGGSTAVAYNTASGYTAAGGNTSGVLSLAGTNTYTGGTTITGGTLQAGNAAAFGGAASAITVNSGAALDLNGKTLTYANALTLNGSGISSGGALTNSSATGGTYIGAITLGSDSLIGGTTGAITVTGAIDSTASAYNLALVGNQAITLSSATNTLSTIASGSGLGALSITNNQALTIGSMTIGGTTYSGLSSTDTILVQTSTDNLTVNNAVTTSSTSAVTSAPAIQLAAGYNGTTSDTAYNIILGSSSSSLITAGSGAIIALYSGAPLSSTNLSAFVAGQTIYNTSYGVTTTTGSLASGAGYYALYRGTQPTMYVIFGSSDTPTYGSAPTITYSFNTLANGTGTSYLSSDTATVNATGTAVFTDTTSGVSTILSSTANAGTYSNVSYTSGLSSTNYSFAATTPVASYTINKANAYVTLTSGQSSTYGNTPSSGYTVYANLAGTLALTTASPTGTAVFTDTTSGVSTILSSTANAGTYSNVSYTSGLSSTNYSFAATTPVASYTINKANAYVTLTSGQSSTYGNTPSSGYTVYANLAGTLALTTASPTGTAVFTDTTSGVSTILSSTANAGTYSNVSYTSGLSSTNYAFNAAASSRSYTVNAAPLNITISKTYDGNYNFTNANQYSTGGALQNLFNNEFTQLASEIMYD